MLQYLHLFAAACNSKNFLGILPTWYKYLPTSPGNGLECNVNFDPRQADQWGFIALAFVDILVRVAGIVALGFIIYGGIRYITSQGEPDATREAQHTVTNAVIGLVIAIIGATVIAFIGKTLGGS